MTIVELKEKLIAQINLIDDRELLDRISRWVELESNNDGIHVMSDGEVEAVNDGLEQMKNGQWITNEEANKRIEHIFKKYSHDISELKQGLQI